MFSLKIGKSYQTENGYIIPRSKIGGSKTERFAIFEILELKEGGRYIKRHTTLSPVEIKKALGLPKKERLDIT